MHGASDGSVKLARAELASEPHTPTVGGTREVTEGLTLVFGATCPGDHRPLVFLIRYGDAGRAVTLQLSVPAPEPGEEGGFLYGAGSGCPVFQGRRASKHSGE